MIEDNPAETDGGDTQPPAAENLEGPTVVAPDPDESSSGPTIEERTAKAIADFQPKAESWNGVLQACLQRRQVHTQWEVPGAVLDELRALRDGLAAGEGFRVVDRAILPKEEALRIIGTLVQDSPLEANMLTQRVSAFVFGTAGDEDGSSVSLEQSTAVSKAIQSLAKQKPYNVPNSTKLPSTVTASTAGMPVKVWELTDKTMAIITPADFNKELVARRKARAEDNRQLKTVLTALGLLQAAQVHTGEGMPLSMDNAQSLMESAAALDKLEQREAKKAALEAKKQLVLKQKQEKELAKQEREKAKADKEALKLEKGKAKAEKERLKEEEKRLKVVARAKKAKNKEDEDRRKAAKAQEKLEKMLSDKDKKEELEREKMEKENARLRLEKEEMAKKIAELTAAASKPQPPPAAAATSSSSSSSGAATPMDDEDAEVEVKAKAKPKKAKAKQTKEAKVDKGQKKLSFGVKGDKAKKRGRPAAAAKPPATKGALMSFGFKKQKQELAAAPGSELLFRPMQLKPHTTIAGIVVDLTITTRKYTGAQHPAAPAWADQLAQWRGVRRTELDQTKIPAVPKGTNSGGFGNASAAVGGRVKIMHWSTDRRPSFWGTHSRQSMFVKPRRPVAKDDQLDYEYDSDDDWPSDYDGSDVEDLENMADEDEEKDDEAGGEEAEWCVPDGYLSEDEGVKSDEEDAVMQATARPEGEEPPPGEEGMPMDEEAKMLRAKERLERLRAKEKAQKAQEQAGQQTLRTLVYGVVLWGYEEKERAAVSEPLNEFKAWSLPEAEPVTEPVELSADQVVPLEALGKRRTLPTPFEVASVKAIVKDMTGNAEGRRLQEMVIIIHSKTKMNNTLAGKTLKAVANYDHVIKGWVLKPYIEEMTDGDVVRMMAGEATCEAAEAEREQNALKKDLSKAKKRSREEAALAHEASGGMRRVDDDLAVGDQVHCNWLGYGKWYHATIVQVNDDIEDADTTYNVDFADGDFEPSVSRDRLRLNTKQPRAEKREERAGSRSSSRRAAQAEQKAEAAKKAKEQQIFEYDLPVFPPLPDERLIGYEAGGEIEVTYPPSEFGGGTCRARISKTKWTASGSLVCHVDYLGKFAGYKQRLNLLNLPEGYEIRRVVKVDTPEEVEAPSLGATVCGYTYGGSVAYHLVPWAADAVKPRDDEVRVYETAETLAEAAKMDVDAAQPAIEVEDKKPEIHPVEKAHEKARKKELERVLAAEKKAKIAELKAAEKKEGPAVVATAIKDEKEDDEFRPMKKAKTNASTAAKPPSAVGEKKAKPSAAAAEKKAKPGASNKISSPAKMAKPSPAKQVKPSPAKQVKPSPAKQQGGLLSLFKKSGEKKGKVPHQERPDPASPTSMMVDQDMCPSPAAIPITPQAPKQTSMPTGKAVTTTKVMNMHSKDVIMVDDKPDEVSAAPTPTGNPVEAL